MTINHFLTNTLVLLAITAQLPTTSFATATPNRKEGCSPAFCLSCAETDVDGSCNICARSFRELKHPSMGRSGGFTCKEETSTVEHCEIYRLTSAGVSDRTQCEVCAYGFFLKNGSCIKNNIENCLI